MEGPRADREEPNYVDALMCGLERLHSFPLSLQLIREMQLRRETAIRHLQGVDRRGALQDENARARGQRNGAARVSLLATAIWPGCGCWTA